MKRKLLNWLLFVIVTHNLLYYSSTVSAATPILVDAGNGTIVDTVNNLAWLKTRIVLVN